MKSESIRRAVSSLIIRLHPSSFLPVEFHITRAARRSLLYKVAHEVIMGPEPRKA
jgi:hypothetical protein